jgi:acyl-CoA synthetase (NDP forming)
VSGVPVVVVRTGADHLAPDAGDTMRAAGLPAYPTPERGVRALAALGRMAASEHRDRVSAPVVGVRLTAGMGEDALKQALAEHGLPVPVGRIAVDRDDAVAAVEEAGGRAVLKAVVPGLLHKSDAGGVVLDVTPERAPEVFDRLAAMGGHVLVEEMVPGGVEALVGTTDSPLGRVLTVGVGGVLTEVMADVALRLLPVDRQDVEEMLDETRLARLLAGVRGRGAADRDALVDTVLAIADVAAGLPPGAELDLNPVTVLARGSGVRILDAALALPEEAGD